MKCEKCGSEHVTVLKQTYVVSVDRSFLWNLLMIFLTFGFWLVWMAVRKRKEKVVSEISCVCQNCGNDWKIGY